MRATCCAAVLSMIAAVAWGDRAGADDGPLLPEEGPWRLVLKEQLKHEKACSLNAIIAYQEVPLGDDVGLDGRASCFDGREFNFTRKRKHQKFSIELCQPTVC
jgi:hypothetical protein